MANVYVWSGAAGAATGADWANAYLTLEAATAAKAAGDTFYVAHDHTQTSAVTLGITTAGTEATPCRVYCVNRAGSVPPVSADLRTTALIATTGASGISLTNTFAEVYGINFSAGDAANIASINLNNSSIRAQRFVNCTLKLNNTSTSSRITFSGQNSGTLCILENTTMEFGSVSQTITCLGRSTWRNTPAAIVGSVVPSILFNVGGHCIINVEGVDLSAVGVGKSLVSLGNSNVSTITFKDCKLGASVNVANVPTNSFGSMDLNLVRCDSGDTNYRTERITYMGAQTTETTIVRTGGATDGTTAIAWKIVTSANSEWEFPFECLPIYVWNETVGSPITVTIQGIWGTASVPLNSDIWIDVEHLGTSGFPLASKATNTKADGLAAGSNLPAGSGTWGGSTTKFALTTTFTPQEKGPLTIYVRAAKPSSTFYIDPKPVIT